MSYCKEDKWILRLYTKKSMNKTVYDNDLLKLQIMEPVGNIIEKKDQTLP